MDASTQPIAMLHDVRFNNPFEDGDLFYDLSIELMDFNLFNLKQEAEQYAERMAKKARALPNIHDRLTYILTHKRYRKGSKKFFPKEETVNQLDAARRSNTSFNMTLSFFPVKVTSKLKTFAQFGSEIDSGEVASVLRFYEIARAINIACDVDACWRITLDGIKYSSVFGYDPKHAVKYSENLNQLIRFFGIEPYLDLIEESNFYPKNFLELADEKEAEFSALYYKEPNGTLAEKVNKLIPNTCLSLYEASRYSAYDLSLIHSPRVSETELPSHLKGVRRHFINEATRRSIRYFALYRVVYETGLYSSHFADCLKCTIHPKPNQVGLYAANRSTALFPHHGQGFLKEGKELSLDNIRIGLAGDIRRNSSNVGYSLNSDVYPFLDSKHPFIIRLT